MLKQLIKKLSLIATLELTASELARAETCGQSNHKGVLRKTETFLFGKDNWGCFSRWRCKGSLGNAGIAYTAN